MQLLRFHWRYMHAMAHTVSVDRTEPLELCRDPDHINALVISSCSCLRALCISYCCELCVFVVATVERPRCTELPLAKLLGDSPPKFTLPDHLKLHALPPNLAPER
jgi:hypothetical protein